MATNYILNGKGITPIRQAIAGDPGVVPGLPLNSQVLYQHVRIINLLPGPIMAGTTNGAAALVPASSGRFTSIYASATNPAITIPVTPPFP
jgi:hypothetical protein